MNFRRFSALVFVLLLSCSVCMLPAAAADAPEIKGTAALLVELNSDQILLSQNADARVYPASLTKIMTCLLTLEHGTLTDTVTVSSTALQGLHEAGSTIGMKVGETMTVEHLLYSIMVSSANEACNVAAEYIAGSVDAFVAMMNEKAASLGCTGTHFANTHGLHDEEHYTTAADLAVITREAMKNNVFRNIVSTATYTIPETNLSAPRKLKTTNQFLLNTQDNPYYDSRVTGVKTGFTTPAGRCLIVTAEDGNLSLLSVVTGCETRILSTGDLEFASFPETEKMLAYGFENFTYKTVLTTLYPMAEIPVSRSAGANFISLAPKEEITALLPADFEESELGFSCELLSSEGVEAPVAAGTELGTVTVTHRGKVLGTTPLIAITGVEKATFLDMINPARYTPQTWLRIVLLLIMVLCLSIVISLLVSRHRRKKRKKRQEKMKRAQKTVHADFGRSDWFERQ